MYGGFEDLYIRYVYRRFCDLVNRPVASEAGAEFTLLERKSDDHNWNFKFTGCRQRLINMGSYNYLGFCETSGTCADAATRSIRSEGVGAAASPQSIGVSRVVRELERKACIQLFTLYSRTVLQLLTLSQEAICY